MRTPRIIIAAALIGGFGTLAMAPANAARVADDTTPLPVEIGEESDATELSAADCEPKALKRYCEYRSRCRTKENPKNYDCVRLDKFVVKIPKRAKQAAAKCEHVRARIKASCFD